MTFDLLCDDMGNMYRHTVSSWFQLKYLILFICVIYLAVLLVVSSRARLLYKMLILYNIQAAYSCTHTFTITVT